MVCIIPSSGYECAPVKAGTKGTVCYLKQSWGHTMHMRVLMNDLSHVC